MERSRESRYAARICDECGIEFRPRERVPIRRGSPVIPQSPGWIATLAIVGVATAIGVRMAMSSTVPTLPATDPIVIQPITFSPIYDPDFAIRPLEPPSVDVVTHRLERAAGRVEATGMIMMLGQPVARPQVHVGFYDSNGMEIGAVLAHVPCSRLDAQSCPWGFSGSEPVGTTEVRIRASGEHDIGDLHPVARLQLDFDDEFEPTDIDANSPVYEMAEGELIPHERGRELEVRVAMPDQIRLRAPKATLVGYVMGGRVELVVPLPSPVGLSRRVELPEHERAIVRWQLWIDGPLEGR